MCFHIVSALTNNENNSPSIQTHTTVVQEYQFMHNISPFIPVSFFMLPLTWDFLVFSFLPRSFSKRCLTVVDSSQICLFMYSRLNDMLTQCLCCLHRMSKQLLLVIVSEPVVPTPGWTFSSSCSKNIWQFYKFEWISVFKVISIKHLFSSS